MMEMHDKQQQHEIDPHPQHFSPQASSTSSSSNPTAFQWQYDSHSQQQQQQHIFVDGGGGVTSDDAQNSYANAQQYPAAHAALSSSYPQQQQQGQGQGQSYNFNNPEAHHAQFYHHPSSSTTTAGIPPAAHSPYTRTGSSASSTGPSPSSSSTTNPSYPHQYGHHQQQQQQQPQQLISPGSAPSERSVRTPLDSTPSSSLSTAAITVQPHSEYLSNDTTTTSSSLTDDQPPPLQEQFTGKTINSEAELNEYRRMFAAARGQQGVVYAESNGLPAARRSSATVITQTTIGGRRDGSPPTGITHNASPTVASYPYPPLHHQPVSYNGTANSSPVDSTMSSLSPGSQWSRGSNGSKQNPHLPHSIRTRKPERPRLLIEQSLASTEDDKISVSEQQQQEQQLSRDNNHSATVSTSNANSPIPTHVVDTANKSTYPSLSHHRQPRAVFPSHNLQHQQRNGSLGGAGGSSSPSPFDSSIIIANSLSRTTNAGLSSSSSSSTPPPLPPSAVSQHRQQFPSAPVGLENTFTADQQQHQYQDQQHAMYRQDIPHHQMRHARDAVYITTTSAGSPLSAAAGGHPSTSDAGPISANMSYHHLQQQQQHAPGEAGAIYLHASPQQTISRPQQQQQPGVSYSSVPSNGAHGEMSGPNSVSPAFIRQQQQHHHQAQMGYSNGDSVPLSWSSHQQYQQQQQQMPYSPHGHQQFQYGPGQLSAQPQMYGMGNYEGPPATGVVSGPSTSYLQNVPANYGPQQGYHVMQNQNSSSYVNATGPSWQNSTYPQPIGGAGGSNPVPRTAYLPHGDAWSVQQSQQQHRIHGEYIPAPPLQYSSYPPQQHFQQEQFQQHPSLASSSSQATTAVPSPASASSAHRGAELVSASASPTVDTLSQAASQSSTSVDQQPYTTRVPRSPLVLARTPLLIRPATPEPPPPPGHRRVDRFHPLAPESLVGGELRYIGWIIHEAWALSDIPIERVYKFANDRPKDEITPPSSPDVNGGRSVLPSTSVITKGTKRKATSSGRRRNTKAKRTTMLDKEDLAIAGSSASSPQTSSRPRRQATARAAALAAKHQKPKIVDPEDENEDLESFNSGSDSKEQETSDEDYIEDAAPARPAKPKRRRSGRLPSSDEDSEEERQVRPSTVVAPSAAPPQIPHPRPTIHRANRMGGTLGKSDSALRAAAAASSKR